MVYFNQIEKQVFKNDMPELFYNKYLFIKDFGEGGGKSFWLRKKMKNFKKQKSHEQN